MNRNEQNKISALYIHIPFCVKKCGYCNFNSIKFEKSIVEAYLDAIVKEIKLLKEKYEFKTIFLGGGTPTALNENQLKKLLTVVEESIDLNELVEYTIEINPGTLTTEKIDIISKSRINRISLGIQSFNDKYLHLLGRIHTGREALNTFTLLRNNGFENINIDLISSLPSQKVKEWENDLNIAISMQPDHISAYSLSFETGTPFKNQLNNGTLKPINEEDDLEMYKLTINKLKSVNYEHYEISNFAINGRKCQHNIIYWENREYVGIGAGAFSFLESNRTSNEPDVLKYIKNINADKKEISFSERLPLKDLAAETIIMGLRMSKGISNNRLLAQTGLSFKDVLSDKIYELRGNGFIDFDNSELKLTEKGLYVADSVMMEFLN